MIQVQDMKLYYFRGSGPMLTELKHDYAKTRYPTCVRHEKEDVSDVCRKKKTNVKECMHDANL